MFCCADCCQEPSSSAASLTPVSRLGRSRCLTLWFWMMFCEWPKCKHQMAPCRVSYGRVASSHGQRRTRQSLSWRRFVLVCKAWLQQEVAAKARPQLRALARQLDVRQWVAGSRQQRDHCRPSCRCRGAAVPTGQDRNLESFAGVCFAVLIVARSQAVLRLR